MFVYLDNAATTKLLPEIGREMAKVNEEAYGNPSSLHKMGLEAELLLKKSRVLTASALAADPEEIFFTGGGTEADNLAILGCYEANKRRGNKIITSTGEHSGIIEPCKRLESQGVEAVYLDIDEYGNIDLKQLEAEIDNKTFMVSLIYVNNELGTLTPVKTAKNIIRQKNQETVFHSDGVQAFGKVDISFGFEGPDLISISSHKIHGPKGVGALAAGKGLKINPLILGGGQEKGLRSGTENVPGIYGFALAADMVLKQIQPHIEKTTALRDYLVGAIKDEIQDIRINTPLENSSPAILNVSFLGCPAEVLLHYLEGKDIYVSTGAACSSKKGVSRILRAAGLSDEVAGSAIRFSFGSFNTKEELDYTMGHLKDGVKFIRKITKR